jgi:methionyl-tRNA formyltransferase
MPNARATVKDTPLRIIFAGTPEFAALHLKALIDSQMKGNNRLVKVAVEDTKHVTSLVKQELLALKD